MKRLHVRVHYSLTTSMIVCVRVAPRRGTVIVIRWPPGPMWKSGKLGGKPL